MSLESLLTLKLDGVLLIVSFFVPLLTVIADLVGILGGLLVGITELDLTVVQYTIETVHAVTLLDFGSGVVKSLVFACIIALVGVSNGFSVVGGAEGVGRATTRAVVVSISYIVVADMIFTYFLNL